jgi:queuine tRNA-ribosyltransferase
MFKANEMLGPILASIQNLRFYMWLVRSAREAILRDDFHEWKVQTLNKVNRRL